MKHQKFWQTESFKSLEREWYARLEKAKFEDAEETVNGNSHLKQRASNSYRNARAVEREAKYAYYQMLASFCNEEAFQDRVERFVLERRAEGAKIKEICEELRKMNERCYRNTIARIIVKYEIKWGIKKKT